MQLHVDIVMSRDVEGNISRVLAYFITPAYIVNSAQNLDLDAVVQNL